MRRLLESHVAVFGLGGVGSFCAEALARSGVGELTLLDGDVVTLSNLNRQLPALTSTCGMYKAKVLARRFADINPGVRLHVVTERFESSRGDLIAGFDYLADAIDSVTDKLDLIQAAIRAGIPIISSMGTGNKRDPSRLRLCDIGETRVCPLARVMRRELKRRGIERLMVVSSDEASVKPASLPDEALPPGRRSVPGSVITVTAAAGLLMASHIIERIAKVE